MEIISIFILTAIVIAFGAIIWIQSERIDNQTKYITRLEAAQWSKTKGWHAKQAWGKGDEL